MRRAREVISCVQAFGRRGSDGRRAEWSTRVRPGTDGVATYLFSGIDLMRLTFARAVRSAAPFSSVARAGLLLASVSVAQACSRFASHEDVFPPIPLTLGEARVRGSDTVYALAGRGYELVAPSREVLPDAQQVLEGAARTYRRYIGEDPPKLVVELRASAPGAGAPPPTPARPAGTGTDTLVLPLLQTRDEREPPRPPTYIARPVGHAWVAAYMTSKAARRAAAPADSASGSGSARPAWLVDALGQLVSPSPYQDVYLAQLAKQPDELIPLRALFDSIAPSLAAPDRPESNAAPDPKNGGRQEDARRGGGRPRGTPDRLDRAELFVVESFAVARFLADREGPEFIGELAARVLGGERVESVLGDAKSVPSDLVAFESAWKTWLASQGAPGRPQG